MEDFKSINEQRDDILAQFAAATLGNGSLDLTPEAKVVDPVEPKVEDKHEDVSPASSPVEPKVEDKPVEEPKVEDGNFEDWDADVPIQPSASIEPAEVATSNDVILSELGKALGLEKVTSKEDVIKAASELVEKTKAPLDTNTPAELLKAIELSQKGGNWHEYLKISTVDYTKADPIELYENYVIDQLTDANGQVNEDEVNDILDSMRDSEKRLKGIELQRQLVYEQKRRLAELENEAAAKKERQDAALKSALSSLQDVNGFRVKDNHRQEVYKWVTGNMMKDLFYGPDGNLDPAKVAQVAFRNLYHDKIHAYLTNKIKHSTARDLFHEVTNAQVTSTSSMPDPTPKKEYGVHDYIKSLEERMLNR